MIREVTLEMACEFDENRTCPSEILDCVWYNQGLQSMVMATVETNCYQKERFKFTGREYCPELGLYYYRARWYDPAVGRFISQDPIGFSAGDTNVYRYVGNAPGDGTDPEGLFFGKGNQALPGTGGSSRLGEGEKIPQNYQPGGPSDLPVILSGKWKISICAGSGHAWIRFENMETGKVHTTGRYKNGYGGRIDENGTFIDPPIAVSGIQWDKDTLKEEGIKNNKFAIRSVTVCNPVIFKGENQFGYGVWGNNCATYARDAWYYYSGEYFYMPGPDFPETVEDWIRRKNTPEVLFDNSIFWPNHRNSILNRMP